MWPDRVSNPGPLTYKSGALPTALRSPAPQLLIQYLMQGFETLHSSAYIWHMQKGNQTLIQVIIAELFPLKRHTCSPFVIALATSFINLFRHSYIEYDNNLNKITFHVGRIKVKGTIAIYRQNIVMVLSLSCIDRF